MPSNWYERVQESALLQGDLLRKCPIPLLPDNLDVEQLMKEPEAERNVKLVFEIYDVIVLSQSCDIETDKLKSILLCPVWPLDNLPDLVLNPDKPDDKLLLNSKAYLNRCDAIRMGYEPRFHMLDACEISGLEHSYSLIDFWTIYNLPKPFLENFASKAGARLRLNPPYVEHLSQAFARYFMRVGLPSPIPKFRK